MYIVLYLDVMVGDKVTTIVLMCSVTCLFVLPSTEPALVLNISSAVIESHLSIGQLYMAGTGSSTISMQLQKLSLSIVSYNLCATCARK